MSSGGSGYNGLVIAGGSGASGKVFKDATGQPINMVEMFVLGIETLLDLVDMYQTYEERMDVWDTLSISKFFEPIRPLGSRVNPRLKKKKRKKRRYHRFPKFRIDNLAGKKYRIYQVLPHFREGNYFSGIL